MSFFFTSSSPAKLPPITEISKPTYKTYSLTRYTMRHCCARRTKFFFTLLFLSCAVLVDERRSDLSFIQSALERILHFVVVEENAGTRTAVLKALGPK